MARNAKNAGATSPETSELPVFRLSSSYVLIGAASWLVPGAGHWLLGYPARGAVLFVCLLGIFWTGESVLAENLAVTREIHPVFYACQIGNGASTLIADQLWGTPGLAPEQSHIQRDLPRHINLGILLCTVSGLLNILAVLHVLDPRTWVDATLRERERRAGSAAGAPAGDRRA